MQIRNDERSLGDLFGDLTREVSALVRSEITLARTEMTQKATVVGKNVATIVVGGLVLYAGFLALLATIVLLLIQFGMPAWLSATIVAVVVLGIGAFLALRGVENLKKTNLTPQQTAATLKEDKAWIQEQTT